jgi:hypothetical protein
VVPGSNPAMFADTAVFPLGAVLVGVDDPYFGEVPYSKWYCAGLLLVTVP